MLEKEMAWWSQGLAIPRPDPVRTHDTGPHLPHRDHLSSALPTPQAWTPDAAYASSEQQAEPRSSLATAHRNTPGGKHKDIQDLGPPRSKLRMGSAEKALGWPPGRVPTSHDIPKMDKTISPTSGHKAAVGAKTNSIDLREVGILWGKRTLVLQSAP
jgi:hypothetical protein